MKWIVYLFATTCATGCFAEGGYTQRQLVLARSMGAVLMLSKDCGVAIPIQRFKDALLNEGLQEADTVDDGEFSKAFKDQAASVVKMRELGRSFGDSSEKIRAVACKALIDNYGPNGTSWPNLADFP